MEINLDFVIRTLVSTAGTTALIGIIAWMARTWIKERLSHSIKHEYDLELEQYKAGLAAANSVEIEQFKARIGTEYDIIKASLLRYSQKQFDLYNELWASLCDLEVCVGTLWESATEPNLRKLAKQMYDARLKVRKSALLMEGRHYRELNHVLDQFEGFQFGKQHLMDLRNAKRNEHVNLEDIKRAIHNNADIKDRLVGLLGDMMVCLKKQIVKNEEPDNCSTNRP